MNDPISLYTLVLAIFTVVLAVASIWQGILTKRSIDLARQEFVASHRPRLRIRLLSHEPFVVGKPIVIRFTIANVGDSTATQVAYDLILRMGAVGSVTRIHWNGKGDGVFDAIRAGAQAGVTHTTDVICPAGEFVTFAPGRLVVGGIVGYSDDNGVVRLTSFRRIKDHLKEGTFKQLDPINPDVEYEG